MASGATAAADPSFDAAAKLARTVTDADLDADFFLVHADRAGEDTASEFREQAEEAARVLKLRSDSAARFASRRKEAAAASGAASDGEHTVAVEEAIRSGLGEEEADKGDEDEVQVGGSKGAAAAGGMLAQIGTGEVYGMDDRYRPRKPRYIHRVRTGYDWNSHNKAYFSIDNPPPKMVQGYKFQVLYPDLIDKSQAPTYRIEPADHRDFCILRFSAGPPYQDVAFKIVNREWDTVPRHGFLCRFDRGVFKLFFNFKRYRWRK